MNGLYCIPPREIVKPEEMLVYPNGIKARKDYRGMWMPTKGGGERGRITTFSTASRRRLREALLTRYVPGVPVWGLTLTMPGWLPEWMSLDGVRGRPPAMCPDGRVDGETAAHMAKCFRTAFERYRHAVHYHFPDFADVHRIELQERGAPHLHSVAWVESARQRCRISELWCESCKDCGWWPYDWDAHWWHGTKWDPLDDMETMLKYLMDHTSKHKQAQLGFVGRQWGYINPKRLVVRTPEVIRDKRVKDIVCRAFGMLRRYRVRDERCPFGSRLTKYHKVDQGISFGGRVTVARIVAWAKATVQHDER